MLFSFFTWDPPEARGEEGQRADGKHECIWCPWVGVAPEWGREGGKTVGEGFPVAAFSWTLRVGGHWRRRWLPAPLFRTSLFPRNTYCVWVLNNQLGKLCLLPLFSKQCAPTVCRGSSTAYHWGKGPGVPFHQGLQFRLLTLSPNGVLHYVRSTDQFDQRASLYILKLFSY